MKEIWKSISFNPGYEHYEISNKGRLRNKNTGKFLKDSDSNGYIRNTLSSSSKEWKVFRHTLVFFQFHPEIDYFNCGYDGSGRSDSMVINHINQIKIDNRLENLELITSVENIEYSMNKPILSISIDDLSDICYYNSAREAEKKDSKNINTAICDCCLKKRISHNNKYWLYQDDDIDAFLEKVKSGEVVAGKGMCRTKRIIGINIKTGEEKIFNSQEEAGRNGFTSPNINRCLHGRQKTHKGYTWHYLDEYLEKNKKL